MKPHIGIPITARTSGNDRVEATGFMCDCSLDIVTINIADVEDGTHIVSIAINKSDFRETN